MATSRNALRQARYRSRLRRKEILSIMKTIQKLERKLIRLTKTQEKHLGK